MTKFEKSGINKRTEREGVSLLLRDPRFQLVTLATKRRILELIGTSPAFGAQTFDLVMTPAPAPPITPDNVDEHFPTLTLVEMTTTKGAVADQALRGFFFGATEREYAMAKALGPRYCFAFVVLNDTNVFTRPFAVLLDLEEVEQRTRQRRVQYQVNFKTDIAAEETSAEHVIVFGEHGDIPLGSLRSLHSLEAVRDRVRLFPLALERSDDRPVVLLHRRRHQETLQRCSGPLQRRDPIPQKGCLRVRVPVPSPECAHPISFAICPHQTHDSIAD